MRYIFARIIMVIGKVIIFLMRLLGRNATTLPGKIALKFYGNLPFELTKNIDVTLVTGTNGKTTTTKMLCSIYEAAGYKVITNVSGANLGSGVVTALIEGLPIRILSKKNKETLKNKGIKAVIEIDEAAFGKYAKDLNPKVIAITNLFRDQLDRYGELSKTREFIRKGINESPKAKILLCADDSLCASLAYDSNTFNDNTKNNITHNSSNSEIYEENFKNTPRNIIDNKYEIDNEIKSVIANFSKNLDGRIFFSGVEKSSMKLNRKNMSATTEAGNCVFCGAAYEYSYRSFGHLGHFNCPVCGFRRPDTSFKCDYERLTNNQFNATYWWDQKAIQNIMNLILPVPGEHNVYNAMTAAGAAFLDGVSFEDIKRGILKAKAGFGRMERFKIGNLEVCIVLVKNPVGLERALDFINNATDCGSVLLLLNDGIADGTDVSWIWDVDFESKKFPDKCFVSGTRCFDMALRLKYAGVLIENISVSYDFVEMFESSLAKCKDGECLYILPNYTSLLELRAYLADKYKLKEIWK